MNRLYTFAVPITLVAVDSRPPTPQEHLDGHGKAHFTIEADGVEEAVQRAGQHLDKALERASKPLGRTPA